MIKLQFDENNIRLVQVLAAALAEYAFPGGGGTPLEPVADEPDLSPRTRPEPDANETAEPETAEPETADGVERDLKGVAFNPETCAKAKDPFYDSGKYAGQWKRKRGTTEDTYNKWYASQVLTETQDAPPAEPAKIDTGAAFGSAVPPNVEPKAGAPKTAGEFMLWISEQQTAGNLSQEAIEGAYGSTGLTVADLFNPDAAVAGASVKQLYDALTA